MKRTDIFRFMAIREPDKLGNVDAVRINASGNGQDTSVLLKMLNDAQKANTPIDAIEKIATDYVNKKLRGATVYTTSLKSLDARLSELGAKIHRKSIRDKFSIVKNEINLLDIEDENLANWKSRLDDSFNAALVLRKDRDADLRGIERAIRTIHVITGIRGGNISDDKSIADALTKTITVSRSIITRTSSKKETKVDDATAKQIKENAERVKKSIEEYDSNKTAIKELSVAYDKDWETRRLLQNEEATAGTKAREFPAVYGGILQKFGKWIGILPTTAKVSIPAREPHKNGTGFQSILAEEITKNISQKTKDRLEGIGSSSDKIEASVAIMRLEELNTDITNNLHSGPTSNTVTKFGGRFDIEFSGNTNEVYVDPGYTVRFRPGTCSTSLTASPIKNDDYTFLPCRFNSLGVGELQVVKQKLIGYEIGEIAHIENVMASEKRSRNHRTLHRTEEFTSFELEREEETERDLETTTRFELQREIDKEIQESTQKEAGITVSGSYGPSVEFSANAGIATESSSSKTESFSTSYSKEVVDRSVHRIQEKIKEKRTLLTIDEVEVINKHSFKNQEPGAVHINGIYSWVNKKYEAQVFNYGKRELIEVIIPEPAAFIRHLATRHPKEGNTITKPLKPGYCVRRKFIPLSPGTLTVENYLDWVSAYNIQNIEPPPPLTQVISTAFHIDPSTVDVASGVVRYINISKTDFKIPPKYEAKKAWFTKPMIDMEWPLELIGGEIAIGREVISFTGTQPPAKLIMLNNEMGVLPIAISIATGVYFAVTIEVECKRTNENLMDWKISTFNSIINRYEILNEEYEEAISDDELFGSVNIQGKNPIENQKIIFNELKRQVITQLTGQTFDGFDAMQENVGEYGYPEQNVNEAWSEGREIRFIEQAFEWENLQYIFYPYFWGKKKDWPITSQLEDTDPLFQSFLQAGSCRLNIAVRPGFVDAVNTYLSIGKFPWDSKKGTTLIACLDIDNDEEEEAVDPFLSITEEMKAQQGAVYFKSEGTVSYVAGDPETQLTGENSTFEDDDINREINIAGEIYMIKSVNKEQQTIILDEDIGSTLQGVTQYAIGAKAIGVPWIVTIPTSLVILGDGSDLPEIQNKV